METVPEPCQGKKETYNYQAFLSSLLSERVLMCAYLSAYRPGLSPVGNQEEEEEEKILSGASSVLR